MPGKTQRRVREYGFGEKITKNQTKCPNRLDYSDRFPDNMGGELAPCENAT